MCVLKIGDAKDRQFLSVTTQIQPILNLLPKRLVGRKFNNKKHRAIGNNVSVMRIRINICINTCLIVSKVTFCLDLPVNKVIILHAL